MKTGVLGLVVGVVVVCAALAAAGPAGAALTVSGTGDGGGCSLRATIEDVNNGTAGGCGTLDGDPTTIEVPAGHYALTGTELQIEEDVVIVGADPANPAATEIDGAERSRVFEVDDGVTATLDALEVTGGRTANGADATSSGGGGLPGVEGGGILNRGTLTLERVLLSGNKTGHGGSGANGDLSLSAQHNGGGGNRGGAGGGIYNDERAILVVRASTITGNETGGGGSGGVGGRGSGSMTGTTVGGQGGTGQYGGDGGGIDNRGTATIVDSTISGNHVGRGGAGGEGGEGSGEPHAIGRGGSGGEGGNGGVVYSPGGVPTYGEFAGGGGIASTGTLEVTGSTIADNTTGAGGIGGGGAVGGEFEGRFETSGKAGHGGGGGLGAGLMLAAGNATLTNDTVVGNRTGDGGKGGPGAQSGSLGGGAGNFGGYGAGIWTIGGSSSPFHLDFVTISGNVLGAAGEGGDAGGGTSGVAGGKGLGAGLAVGPSFSQNGVAIELKNSVVVGDAGDGTCAVSSSEAIRDGGHDVSYPDATCPGVDANPLLGALANDGGPTETMLPGAGSAAIGIVPSASCSPYVDQRGDSRPGSGKSACDAGAVETGEPGGGGGAGGGGGSGGGGAGGSEPGAGTGGGSSGGGSATTPGTGSSSGTGSSGSGSPTGGSGSKSPPAPVVTGKATVGAVKVRGTLVSVPISCAGPKDVTCVVRLVLATKGPKAMTIGAVSARVPGGATKTVTVSLDGAGKSDLAKARSLKATLTAEESGRTKPVSVRAVTFLDG